MDHPLLRAAIRSLLSEMSHYAPVKRDYAARFPHLAKGHESTFEDSLAEAVGACRELGDAPFLYRAHRAKEKSTGILVVKTEGWRKGRMALTMKTDPGYEKFMEQLVSTLGFENIVYTSFGSGRPQFGSPEVFLPLQPYEVAWNPKVDDLFVVYRKAIKEGTDPDEVIEGYQRGWPSSAPAGTEVIVDCDRYMLLSPSTMAHTLFYHDKAGASNLMKATTYNELADALSTVKR